MGEEKKPYWELNDARIGALEENQRSMLSAMRAANCIQDIQTSMLFTVCREAERLRRTCRALAVAGAICSGSVIGVALALLVHIAAS